MKLCIVGLFEESLSLGEGESPVLPPHAWVLHRLQRVAQFGNAELIGRYPSAKAKYPEDRYRSAIDEKIENPQIENCKPANGFTGFAKLIFFFYSTVK